MAIAFDTTAEVVNTNSWSHTVTGSNPFLLVHICSVTGDIVTAATYNSVSMTLNAKSNALGGNQWDYSYYLFAPATGAHSVSVTTTSGTIQYGVSVSYTGAPGTLLDNTAISTGTATSSSDFANTITSVNDNCWHIGTFNDVTGRPLLAGTGTTRRGTGGDSNNGWFRGDNNAAITPAGSNTINAKLTVGSGNAVFFGMTLSPTAVPFPVNVTDSSAISDTPTIESLLQGVNVTDSSATSDSPSIQEIDDITLPVNQLVPRLIVH